MVEHTLAVVAISPLEKAISMDYWHVKSVHRKTVSSEGPVGKRENNLRTKPTKCRGVASHSTQVEPRRVSLSKVNRWFAYRDGIERIERSNDKYG